MGSLHIPCCSPGVNTQSGTQMNIALTGIHSIICFQAFSEKNLGEDMLSLCELFNVSAQRVVIAFGLQQKEGSVAQ